MSCPLLFVSELKTALFLHMGLPSNDINTVPRNRALFGPVAFALVMRFQGPWVMPLWPAPKPS